MTTCHAIDQSTRPKSEQLGLGYDLIPWEAIRRLSRVFKEGQLKYKEAAVNATNIEKVIGEKDWIIERYNHAMDHLAKWKEGNTEEDHLAKVMFFCAIVIGIEGTPPN